MRVQATPRVSRLAVGLLLLTFCATHCAVSAYEADIVQERFDAPTTALNGAQTVVQSFVCRRANLCQLELLPAVYGSAGQGTLTLRLRQAKADGLEVGRQTIDVTQIADGAPLSFVLHAQPDSAGQQYELLIDGHPGVNIGLWYSSVDAYGGGNLWLNGRDTAGDLRFVTRYHYDLPMMVRDTEALLRDLWLAVPMFVLLMAPGYLLCQVLAASRGEDAIGRLALSVATSLSAIPVILQWSTALGLHWDRTRAMVALGAAGALILVRLLRAWHTQSRPRADIADTGTVVAMTAVFLSTLLLRLLQVRSLVVPAWVDSLQHAVVTELVALSGQLPRSYEPLLPIPRFIYHPGFHANAAVFHWLSQLPVPQAMLILGQVLNAASVLMAYLLTRHLTQRRTAAVVAATVVGLISYMPAYYVSWGRYTQLTGLLLLPAAAVTAMDWLAAPERNVRLLLLAALLQSGMFLTHVRVTVFGACLLAVYLLIQSIDHLLPGDHGANRELRIRAGLLAAAALAMSMPWLWQLVSGVQAALRATGGSFPGDPAYNVFPWELVLIPHNRELLVLAGIGALRGVLRRDRATLLILGWCCLVALVVNPSVLGLSSTNLVNNATAVIALFLPLSVLDGQAAAFLWDEGFRLLRRVCADSTARAVRATAIVLLLVLAMRCAWGMVTIANPATILVTAEDLEAMSWISERTAPDAVFLINTRHWQQGTYCGTDGGYWIHELTGRRTLLPDLSYSYGTPDYVQHVSELARAVSEVTDAHDPRLQAILEQEGVTHVYLGAKGGPLTPQMFLNSSQYRRVYSSGAVWIFEVAPLAQNKAPPMVWAVPSW